MPWRLIGFIAVFAVFFLFIVFNLENKCDINFGFRLAKDVPVFITVFSAFIFGMLCAMPFIFGVRSKKKPGGGARAKQPGKARRGGKTDGDFSGKDSAGSGDSPYGIN